MSIRRRMTVTLVAALLVMLGAAGALLYGYLREELTHQFDDVLRMRSATLGSLLRQGEGGRVDFDFNDNTMPEFESSRSPEYFQLWAQDGTPIERSRSLGDKDLKVDHDWRRLPQIVDAGMPDGRKGRILSMVATPTPERHEEHELNNHMRARPQNYILAVTRDRTALDRTLATIGIADVAGIILLSLGFGVLVPLVIARNLRPLNTIAAQANQIDAHSLGTRFPVETMPNELRPICTKLNDSLSRLQGAFERERRFSGDVAHELRTPIAELRLLADLGVKYNEPGTPVRRSFHDALEVAIKMERIVSTLLEMMAPDAPLHADELENVTMTRAVEQAWKPLELDAAVKGITLDRQGPAEGTVRSSPTMLGRILSNLLSNAVEYSPEKSTIVFQQEVRPGRMVVTITNPVCDLTSEDLEHLSEPFWRKDAARTGGRHVGLGLALVSRYAQRLEILIHWSLPSVNVFQVQLEIPV